ncbi:MAG: hypothetical protein ACPG4Z_03015, partial [Chitinophagales bacterium]
MSKSTTFKLSNLDDFKRKALQWANQFTTFCCLDSNQYSKDKYSNFEWAIAIDSLDSVEGKFKDLALFQEKNKAKWQFGFMTYDLKNEVEKLQSSNIDFVEVPN